MNKEKREEKKRLHDLEIQNQHKLGGAVESPEDKRDWRIDDVMRAAVPLPEEYMTEGKVPVLNQMTVGSCHDDQTQVLTHEGWKLFKDITKEDRLASVNPETYEVIFEHPTDILSYDYAGDMVVGKHASLDFKVTPNHKMLLRKWNEPNRTLEEKYQFIEASDIGWYAGLLNECYQIGEEQGCLVLPEEKIANGNILPEMRIGMRDWVQFLGIYLAEGTAYKSGAQHHWRIQIAAVKKREKKYINDLLTRIGVVGRNEQKDRFHFHNKRIWKKLEEYGLIGVKSYNKFVPSFIFDLDASYIQDFLYGFAMGDGTFSSRGGVEYFTSSPQLADEIERLLILSGSWCKKTVRPPRQKRSVINGREVCSRHTAYCIDQWKGKNLSIDRKANITTEFYQGKVYCATVPTYHTLITKRNNNILISGNCVAHALASACAFGEYKAGFNYHHDFSRGFIYANRRDTDYQGEGMIMREALKQLNHEGDCLYPTFPWNEDYPDVKKRLQEMGKVPYKEASQYAISSYFRCYSEREIKEAIMKFGAVVVSITTYESFSKDCPVPKPEEKSTGGHAMCCYGWDKTGWWVRNSWSSLWGYKGDCHIPYEYPVKEWWGIVINKDIPQPKPKSIFKRFFDWCGYYLSQGWYYVKRFFKKLFLKKKK